MTGSQDILRRQANSLEKVATHPQHLLKQQMHLADLVVDTDIAAMGKSRSPYPTGLPCRVWRVRKAIPQLKCPAVNVLYLDSYQLQQLDAYSGSRKYGSLSWSPF